MDWSAWFHALFAWLPGRERRDDFQAVTVQYERLVQSLSDRVEKLEKIYRSLFDEHSECKRLNAELTRRIEELESRQHWKIEPGLGGA